MPATRDAKIIMDCYAVDRDEGKSGVAGIGRGVIRCLEADEPMDDETAARFYQLDRLLVTAQRRAENRYIESVLELLDSMAGPSIAPQP